MSDYEIIMILLTVLGFLMAVVKPFKNNSNHRVVAPTRWFWSYPGQPVKGHPSCHHCTARREKASSGIFYAPTERKER